MKKHAYLFVVVLLGWAVPAIAQNTGSTNIGLTTSPSVTGDANGTLIGHVRFLDKMFNDVWDSSNHKLQVNDTILNGSLGATNDAAVTGDANGTLIAHLRYLDKFVASIWDSVNNRANVAVQNGSGVDGNNYALIVAAASATTTGDPTECAITSAASTNSTSCKASAGQFYGVELYNTTTTVYYLRLYNLAAGPTCSSATGFVRSIPIPPAAAAGQVGGAIRLFTLPVAYSTGIAYCLTGGGSSTDNTNAATGIYGAILKF